MSTVAGISLIMETNEQVDQAAELLQAIGLQVEGGDGFVQVKGPTLNLSIMRGTMIDVPPLGGLLLQVTVDDVPAAVEAVREHGGVVGLGPTRTDWGTYSAFVQSPTCFTLELSEPSVGRSG
jgi:hypothetical protein